MSIRSKWLCRNSPVFFKKSASVPGIDIFHYLQSFFGLTCLVLERNISLTTQNEALNRFVFLLGSGVFRCRKSYSFPFGMKTKKNRFAGNSDEIKKW